MIVLEDLKEMAEKEIIEHLANDYAGDKSGFDYGKITDHDIAIAKEKLKNMKVLFAYESVGDYGCDSNSYFLLKDKKTKKLYEVFGSHCSCYGFEGQLRMEEATIEQLKDRVSKGNLFYAGGYDRDETENQRIGKEFILSLK